jgi:3-isopropylmalate/(R)-2-methylmalate dehydratase small subunit
MMMKTFTLVNGKIAPMMDTNIDTDVIMPKQFLKGIDRSNLDRGLFYDLRFLPSGEINADFILNRSAWQGSQFMVVGPNFGCGSSREHAVWGLQQFGIRALIGTTFAGIFADNCQRNGVLLIKLKPQEIKVIEAQAAAESTNTVSIDLPGQKVVLSDNTEIRFEIDGRSKEALIKGLDAIGMTLEYKPEILAFEKNYLAQRPWL